MFDENQDCFFVSRNKIVGWVTASYLFPANV